MKKELITIRNNSTSKLQLHSAHLTLKVAVDICHSQAMLTGYLLFVVVLIFSWNAVIPHVHSEYITIGFPDYASPLLYTALVCNYIYISYTNKYVWHTSYVLLYVVFRKLRIVIS